MNRRALYALSHASIALLLVAGRAEAKPFREKARTAFTREGLTSTEIGDGAIGCAQLAPEVRPNGCPDPGTADGGDGASAGAQNVFVDGFTQADKVLPSTPSANVPAASIAQLTVGEGSQVIFASIVWSANPATFTGIVTCHLVPPNGPNSKAEYIGHDTNTGTLFVQTTNVGPGVVDFRCSDQDAGSDVHYRFVQLTAIPVPSLTRTNLP